MTAKKGKVRISKVKRNNQKRTKLSKQGKLKHKRHKKVVKFIGDVKNQVPAHEEEEESDHGEGLLEMVDNEDLTFLKNAIVSRSYDLLKKIRYKESHTETRSKKRPIGDNEDDDIEGKYEESLPVNGNKKTKYLLPIKTKEGLVPRSIEVLDSEVNQDEKPSEEVNKEEKEDGEENSDEEIIFDEHSNEDGLNPSIPLSTAELLAYREEVLEKRKFQIGILSSGLLENPEIKVKNFKYLLEMLEEKTPEVHITVKKLAAVSLLEVFKDLLPAYQIKHQENTEVKLKKATLKLQAYEKSLLKAYKIYLQKLERLVSVLRPKKGNTKLYCQQELLLGERALCCLCDLLVSHPYFNFSRNLIQMLVPFLNHRLVKLREIVADSIKTIFKEDKKGEISLDIVRSINHLVKSRSHAVHSEALSVLLYLRIKDVNLDKEKEEQIKQKKFKTHRQKLLTMSKRERKRSKKLEELEKELLETKAEESKKTKQHFLTEITKVVFTIYFRVLKRAPSSRILSTTLEGLAKFAHCINLDFYHDLVNVMDQLFENEHLGYREQLHCVETVFTILSGQGDVLNIDPFRFYTHLYKNLLVINAGKNHSDLPIALRTLDTVLIKRKKKITHQRLLAFTKRLCTLALQVLHNGALGCLGLVKNILIFNKSVDILLDPDSSVGEGRYFPELEEPEYCNANSTALWELATLQRHYHPTVQKFAHNIISSASAPTDSSTLPELSKLSAEELYRTFDPSCMAFHPPVPVPRKSQIKIKTHGKLHFLNTEFEEHVKSVMNKNHSKGLLYNSILDNQ